MLTAELINNEIPRLQLQDSIARALELMQPLHLTHLPVLADEKYLGLIGEENLLQAHDKKISLESLQENFITNAVGDTEHFLAAVNFSNRLQTTAVPVITEERGLAGVIPVTNLMKALSNFSGADLFGGIIILEMERLQFSISEISRIVESNDATILHLNTTTNPETGILTVTINLNKKDLAAIVASFERYEYNVAAYFGNEKFGSEIQSNFRHLMNYLDI